MRWAVGQGSSEAHVVVEVDYSVAEGGHIEHIVLALHVQVFQDLCEFLAIWVLGGSLHVLEYCWFFPKQERKCVEELHEQCLVC